MFDGQNDGGIMNRQTLFVKVSDTSGADMPSQNPYTQILAGGGYWNSHSAKESGLIISLINQRKKSQNSSQLNLKSELSPNKPDDIFHIKCFSESGICSPAALLNICTNEDYRQVYSQEFEAPNPETHALCRHHFKSSSFKLNDFRNEFLKHSPTEAAKALDVRKAE